MVDISTIIEYDRLYPVEIVNPITREKTGITINMVSRDSRRVVAAQRDLQAALWDEAVAKAADGAAPDTMKQTSAERLAIVERSEAVSLSAAIDSWDWGEHTFGHIAGSGKASRDDADFLVNHPNAGWIVAQLEGASKRIENFSQTSPKGARTTSKKK